MATNGLDIFSPPYSQRISKEEAAKAPSSCACFLVFFDFQNLPSVIFATCLADAMLKVICAAAGASDDAGSIKFPVG